MSSFNNPHQLYLFDMKNGKKKLAYGSTPEDAYENLRLRLTDQEIADKLPGAQRQEEGRLAKAAAARAEHK